MDDLCTIKSRGEMTEIELNIYVKPSFIVLEIADDKYNILWKSKVEPYIEKYYKIEDKRNRYNAPQINGFPVNKKYVEFYMRAYKHGILPIGFKTSLFSLRSETLALSAFLNSDFVRMRQFRPKRSLSRKQRTLDHDNLSHILCSQRMVQLSMCFVT